MYSDSQLNITTQVLEYDRGGGGRTFSFSSNTPTDPAPDNFKEKRPKRGDVNTLDRTIFWCRTALGKDRWLTPEEYTIKLREQREYQRKYRSDNRQKCADLQRRWREKNPQHASKYIKRRYAEDPEFALAYKVRARVYQAVKRGGASKSGRTEELVGCSFDFLRQHIERQFRGGMSWDNPGSFHIDHVVPLAAFDLSDPMQLKVACNWQNLRPIPPKKNMSKGSKLTEPQLPLPLTVHNTTTYSL